MRAFPSLLQNLSGHLSLEFGSFRLCTDEIKYTIEECKERDATYAAPPKIKARLNNKELDEIKEFLIKTEKQYTSYENIFNRFTFVLKKYYSRQLFKN